MERERHMMRKKKKDDLTYRLSPTIANVQILCIKPPTACYSKFHSGQSCIGVERHGKRLVCFHAYVDPIMSHLFIVPTNSLNQL